VPTYYDPTTHDIYVALFRARQKSPGTWSDAECTRVLTSVMASKRWSWHVVGITPAAMETFATLGFRYKSGRGLQRAHLRPRIETVREVMSGKEPLDAETFIRLWVQNDRVVICARGENRNQSVPPYVVVGNGNAELFNCEGVLAGWHHGDAEVAFLRDLQSHKDEWELRR
jgi:hypothetical protein